MIEKRVRTEYPVEPETREVFRRVLRAMNRARVPYAVGGAFALNWYSGFWRVAKDLDLMLLPEHVGWAMRVLESLGFVTRMRHVQWLADALLGDHKVDLVFGMGNWMDDVDTTFLERAHPGIVLGARTRVVPVEELIFSKSFVASRERYDAADVYHLLVATNGKLDWRRLLSRFGEHWEVLLSHLVMFRYVFPSHRDLVPSWVFDELLRRLDQSLRERWQGGRLCRGFLLDGIGTYSLDVHEWGYRDARQEIWEERMRRREREEAA